MAGENSMKVNEAVRKKKEERGIPVSELSRRTGIGYEALRTSLECNRNITATELLMLCKELDMTLADFEGTY